MNDIKLGKSIKFLSASLDKHVNKELKAFGISLTQGIVLIWLEEAEENTMSIKQIERRFGTAQSTVFGIISRLESKGLVQTHIVERKKIVEITGTGLELATDIKEVIAKIDELFFEGFTDCERTLFIELIKKAEKNFSK